MSDVLVEVKNQGFTRVTIQKTSTGEPIATIDKGEPSKTFSLINGADSVEINAVSSESATVSLEGAEVDTPVSVHGMGVEKELLADEPIALHLSTPTILTLQSAEPSRTEPVVESSDGVKCGEVIVVPEPS